MVVVARQMLNVSGSLDLCYYNFLCAHPVGALSDFNHVLSNLGYLLLGALYMLQLRRRRVRRDRHPRDEVPCVSASERVARTPLHSTALYSTLQDVT